MGSKIDLGTAVAGGVHDRVEDVLGGVVDRDLGAEVAAELRLVRSAGDREHPGAGRDGELDRRRTDRAGAAAHDHGLAGLERGAFVQGEVADVEGQRERRRLGVVELGRCLEDVAGERALGEAAQRLRRDADDPSPEPLLGAVADRLDDPGDVHAEGERRLGHHGRHASPAAGDVAEVERGRRDGHAHLAGARLRHLDVVADLDGDTRLAVADHSDCPHVTPITR